MSAPPRLPRLSINQKTVNSWTVEDLVRGCDAAGITSVGLWREHVAACGLEKAATLVRDAGLRVSTLCRGGFLTGSDAAARAEAVAENRRAIDEAATLGTGVLVLVLGGIPEGSRGLREARAQVADGIAELVPHALDAGVQLAIEPLHPMYVADRAVVSTLGQALDIAEAHPAEAVGVVVDTYHVWWDPDVAAQIARAGAGGRISSFQVCDWILPLPADVLMGRGYMGEGFIDFRELADLVEAAGYDGDIEVEIFNTDIWAQPGEQVLAEVAARFRDHVV